MCQSAKGTQLLIVRHAPVFTDGISLSEPVPGRPQCIRDRVDGKVLQAWTVSDKAQSVDFLIDRTAASYLEGSGGLVGGDGSRNRQQREELWL